MKCSRALTGRTHHAIKYTYNLEEDEWSTEEGLVRVAEKAFAEGAMRQCFRANWYGVDRHLNSATEMKYVIKMFKSNIVHETQDGKEYFDEALTQTVAASFAHAFNERNMVYKGRCAKIFFLSVSVICLPDLGNRLCQLEPFLEGHYVKHNDNDGKVESPAELPQAFSHFTYEASKHDLLVCDLQGVGNRLTDPQIHSRTGRGFGAGNQGAKGIQRFLLTHKCNGICRQLNLPAPTSILHHRSTDQSFQQAIPNAEPMFHPANPTCEWDGAAAHQSAGILSHRPSRPQSNPLISPADVNPIALYTAHRQLCEDNSAHREPSPANNTATSNSAAAAGRSAASRGCSTFRGAAHCLTAHSPSYSSHCPTAHTPSHSSFTDEGVVQGRDCPEAQLAELAAEAERLAHRAAKCLGPSCGQQLRLMSSLLRSLHPAEPVPTAP